MTVEQELTHSKEEEIELLVKNKIKYITSSSVSPNRKYILVTTDKGFVLVYPESSHFTR